MFSIKQLAFAVLVIGAYFGGWASARVQFAEQVARFEKASYMHDGRIRALELSVFDGRSNMQRDIAALRRIVNGIKEDGRTTRDCVYDILSREKEMTDQ